MRIPPFITTLGGMFIFRGTGRLVLDSKTVSVQDPAFLNIFTAYIKIPGLDTDGRILSPLIVGVIAVVIIFYIHYSFQSQQGEKRISSEYCSGRFRTQWSDQCRAFSILLSVKPVQRYLRHAGMGSSNLSDL